MDLQQFNQSCMYLPIIYLYKMCSADFNLFHPSMNYYITILYGDLWVLQSRSDDKIHRWLNHLVRIIEWWDLNRYSMYIVMQYLTILIASLRYSQILFWALIDIKMLKESMRHLFRDTMLVISRLSVGIFDGFQW